jgi:hypothetical protein
MHEMEPSCANPVVGGMPTDAQCRRLPTGDDVVLIADALGMGVVARRARDLVPAGAAGPGGAVAARS